MTGWQGTALEQAVASSRRLAPRTKKLYLRRVQAFVAYAGATPHRWSMETLEAWRDQLLHDGLKPQTVNLYMAAVKFAAKRAQERGLVPPLNVGVAERTRTPVMKAAPRALTKAQCSKLLATCDGTRDPRQLRDRAMILVGLNCAFRREELVTIKFDSIRGARITVIAKGQRMHVVAANKQTLAALHAWKTWLRAQGVTSGFVFRNLRLSVTDEWIIGKNLTADGFAKILKARGEAAGLEGLHPHMLRHTFTSLALAAGMAPWRIKKILGHKSDLMMERYAHDLDPEATGDEFPEL